MKIKIDYVTNSSSSSFMISMDKLTDIQILMIHDHFEAAAMFRRMGSDIDFGYMGQWDKWNITEEDGNICGETSMDNFNMMALLRAIGIKEEDIHYEHN